MRLDGLPAQTGVLLLPHVVERQAGEEGQLLQLGVRRRARAVAAS